MRENKKKSNESILRKLNYIKSIKIIQKFTKMQRNNLAYFLASNPIN